MRSKSSLACIVTNLFVTTSPIPMNTSEVATKLCVKCTNFIKHIRTSGCCHDTQASSCITNWLTISKYTRFRLIISLSQILKMTMIQKLAIAVFLLQTHSAFAFRMQGFGISSIRKELVSLKSTNGEDENASRREWLNGAVGIGATFLASPAWATEDGGRLIKFNVDNLEGVPGQTGSFTIRTYPTWSPNGVKRFEVCGSRKRIQCSVVELFI